MSFVRFDTLLLSNILSDIRNFNGIFTLVTNFYNNVCPLKIAFNWNIENILFWLFNCISFGVNTTCKYNDITRVSVTVTDTLVSIHVTDIVKKWHNLLCNLGANVNVHLSSANTSLKAWSNWA